TEEQVQGWINCALCIGHGWVSFTKCRRCSGTGKYTNKKGDATFDCYTCKGMGTVPSIRIVKCWECNGFGSKYMSTKSMIYRLCYTCSGTGEIKIYNPVIPKGILTGLRR